MKNQLIVRVVPVAVLALLMTALDSDLSAKEEAEDSIFDVLQLAETVSGPGQFAFPLFAPIDLGSGYEDRVAPIVVVSRPAPNEVNVPVDSSIKISLADYGSGIDGGTLRLLLNNELVNPSVTEGFDNTVDVLYESTEPFGYAQTVEVSVSAADFSQNIMPSDTFAFTTNMDATPRPTISISTNKSVYTNGQLLVVMVSITNPTDTELEVDGFIAVDVLGTLLYFPTFDTSPRAISLQLPPGFEMKPTVLWTMPLYGIPDGTYTWYAGLENVETGDIGQISSAQFDFVSMP